MGAVDGKSVLVTGGASGIGRATALAFAREGASCVTIADLDDAAAEETVAAITGAGGHARYVRTDVSDEAQVARLVEGTAAECGRLDAAFNNAGISDPMSTFHELSLEAWDRMIRINLTAVFLCLKHELRQMTAQGHGVLVNTSSGAGRIPAPGQPHYTAAKHGVVGLTKCVAQDYFRQGIRCNAILPGTVDTPMLRGFIGESDEVRRIIEKASPAGLMAPEDMAGTVVWLCSDAAAKVNGQSIVIDGGGILA